MRPTFLPFIHAPFQRIFLSLANIADSAVDNEVIYQAVEFVGIDIGAQSKSFEILIEGKAPIMINRFLADAEIVAAWDNSFRCCALSQQGVNQSGFMNPFDNEANTGNYKQEGQDPKENRHHD